MKTLKPIRLAGLMLTGAIGMLSANTVFAAAGDNIANQATLSYSVGGAAQAPEPSNTVNLTEDRVLDIDVAVVGGTTQVSAGATERVLTFTVTNNGNGTQDVLLTALNNNLVADQFDVTSQVFVDTVVDGSYVNTDDTGVFIDELAAGASATVFIVSTMAAGPLNAGDIANVSLVTQVAAGGAAATEGAAIIQDNNAHFSPGGTYSNGATVVISAGVGPNTGNAAGGAAEPVFGDLTPGTVSSAGVADIASNGQFSADNTYTVIAANVSVTKTQSVIWDPVNGNSNPKAIPGAYVQYTLVIDNPSPAATGSAILTAISDTLQAADLALDPDFVTNAGPGNATNAAGDAIEIVTAGSRLSAGTSYCTGDAGDADNDGCSYTGGVGGTVSVVMSDLVNASITAMAAEVGPPAYAEGELAVDDTITIRFNAIIQ